MISQTLPTYLFAIVVGNYSLMDSKTTNPTSRIYARPSLLSKIKAKEIFELT